MAEQAIAPIIPNLSMQAEAVAGSSAAIFTATDRKIIEELGGQVNPNRPFLDILKERPLNAKVENQETTVQPHQDIKELEGRKKDHDKMLKHSVLQVPRERVEIKNELPDQFQEQKKAVAAPARDDHADIVHKETIAIVRQLNLNPSEIIDKFNLGQKDLLSLVSRIKELHLKRLLTEDKKEFDAFSEEIKKETVISAKKEAVEWLVSQLDKLTREAAEYKLRLLGSLQAMDYSKERENNIKWLTAAAARYTA